MAAAAKILPLGLLHMRLFQLWVKRAETREIKITSHPEVVVQIWQRFGKADVDLFAAKESTHCPYGSPSYLHLAWPRLCLIAFAPDCSAPWSSSQILSGQSSPFASWAQFFFYLISLLKGSPWEILTIRDLFSRFWGQSWSEIAVGYQLIDFSLSTEVETILNTRVASFRKLHALKWHLFESWCARYESIQVNCPVGSVGAWCYVMLNNE